MRMVDDDILVMSTQSQIIFVSKHYQAVVKIIYLERVNSKSYFFTLANCLYLAAYSQMGDLYFYKLMEFERAQAKEEEEEAKEENEEE